MEILLCLLVNELKTYTEWFKTYSTNFERDKEHRHESYLQRKALLKTLLEGDREQRHINNTNKKAVQNFLLGKI